MRQTNENMSVFYWGQYCCSETFTKLLRTQHNTLKFIFLYSAFFQLKVINIKCIGVKIMNVLCQVR